MGALKSYLFAPIFAVFGVSPATIRFPAIAISALSIFVAYRLALLLFPRWIATLLTVSMATDPALIFNSRLDWGPVVLMIFLKLSALFFFFRLAMGARNAAIPLSIALALGLYDKLNFIWFVAALLLAAILFYRKEVSSSFGQGSRLVRASAVLFILSATLAFFLALIQIARFDLSKMALSHLWERLCMAPDAYASSMDGTGLYRWIVKDSKCVPSLVNAVTGLATLTVPAIALTGRWLHVSAARAKVCYFFLTLFVVIVIEIFVTPQAGGSHHIMMLWPLHHLLLGACLAAVAVRRDGSSRALPQALGILAFGVVIVSQARTNHCYLEAFSVPQAYQVRWSARIYDLVDFLAERGGDVDEIVSADWGIHNQVFSLARANRDKFRDLWGEFEALHIKSREEQERFFNRFFKGKTCFLLLHAPDAEAMPNVRSNFRAFCSTFFDMPKRVQVLFEEGGRPLYEVYRLDARLPKDGNDDSSDQAELPGRPPGD
jgi:hypothetical protein